MDKQNSLFLQWNIVHNIVYIKGNEILIHATTWMSFENITLNESSKLQSNHILYDFIHMKDQQ